MKKYFFIDDYISLNQNGTITFGIDTENCKTAGVVFGITGEDGKITIETRENSQFSAGTVVKGLHTNRNIAKNHNLKVVSNPTVTNQGTVMRRMYAGQNKVAGNIDRQIYTILKPKTKYTIKITNTSNTNNVITYNVLWFEK